MKLTFEYTQTIREGLSPQVVHMMDNGIRVIYLSNDGLVKGLEAFPGLGLYENLTFKDIGRVSADMEVSKPSPRKSRITVHTVSGVQTPCTSSSCICCRRIFQMR